MVGKDGWVGDVTSYVFLLEEGIAGGEIVTSHLGQPFSGNCEGGWVCPDASFVWGCEWIYDVRV